MPFKAERGKTGNDCVIVALSSISRKSYDEVLKDCYRNLSTNVKTENHLTKGFRSETYIKVYESYVGRKAVRLKRANSLVTGLVAFHRAGRKSGHLVLAILGMIHDTDGSETPIKEYQAKYAYHVRNVWM